MRIALLVAAVVLGMSSNVAWSCEGPAGAVIFEDNFADDSGGWKGAPPDVVLKDGKLYAHPNPRGLDEKYSYIVVPQSTFYANNGDYCTEFVLPNPPAPDNDIAAGLHLFITGDASAYIDYQIWTDGQVDLTKKDSTSGTVVFSQKFPNFDHTKPTTLRLVAKQNKLTMYVNGTKVKALQFPIPTDHTSFGVSVQGQKTSTADPVVEFRSFKVTTGE